MELSYYPFSSEAYLNMNCNAQKPGNVNPEFGANEPGCGCSLSYNGGAGAGTADCGPCSNGKPYEPGFSDKKRDETCCIDNSRVYQKPLVNKKACECTDTFKYVPEFNYGPPLCPPKENGCGCTSVSVPNRPPTSSQCSKGCTSDFKYVPEFNYSPQPCPPEDSSCKPTSCGCAEDAMYQEGLTNKKPPGVCGVRPCCDEPDTYQSINNTDAQRYKGKGPDRRNFYSDDDCSSCRSNNANDVFDEETDWSEIRRLAYGGVESCSASPKLPRIFPSLCCEQDNYHVARREI